ncbi:MAG: hypothetical protein ACK55Z_37070, partial [bacterium]
TSQLMNPVVRKKEPHLLLRINWRTLSPLANLQQPKLTLICTAKCLLCLTSRLSGAETPARKAAIQVLNKQTNRSFPNLNCNTQ